MTENALDLAPSRTAPRPSLLDGWARDLVLSRLDALRSGCITLHEAGGSRRYGDPSSPLRADVRVDDPRFYRALALRGVLGGTEAYMDGLWRSDDLTAVVRILTRDRQVGFGLDRGFARLLRPSLALFHALRRNDRAGSRRNIAAHYDLGNEFFELFLDPTLTYSSGIFETPEDSMEEASVAKYERICRKLRLGAGDHVLEIGTGWGGFALHAAARHGCRVTTTTISRRQCERARERVAAAGLADRVEVLLEDYRDLAGGYDKLVSIEMIEAVGREHLPEFFRLCSERLRSQGRMLLQAITIGDQDFDTHTRTVDFIKRYIFPGGELVSLGALNDAATDTGGLRLTHWEDFTPHYAETLRRWRQRMMENLPRLRALALDDRFLRMWEMYFCYCEGGFEERHIGVAQALFEKAGSRLDPVLGRLE